MVTLKKWLCFLAIGLFLADVGMAATVVSKVKKRRIIKIDSGVDGGFAKGVKVCFMDSEGKKVGCGKVVRAKPDYSFVRVSKKVFAKVQKGMDAELPDGGGGSSMAMAGGKSASASAGGGKHRTNFKMFYLLTPVPTAQYNKVSYLAPENNDGTVESLWQTAESSGISFLGGGFELEFGIGNGGMSLAVGGRYRLYRDFLAEADYDLTDTEVYASTTITASAPGVYFDYYYLQFGGGPFYFRIGTGIDIDMSTITILSDRLSENTAKEEFPIATATSKATVIGLSLPLQMNYFLDPLGFVFNIRPVVPLTASGVAFSGTVDDPNVDENLIPGGSVETGEEDLEIELAHTKASFGAEIQMGLYFAF